MKMFTEDIIQSALGNSAGTILNENSINVIVIELTNTRNFNKNYIDNLIAENESESGYLTKANDFIYILNPYIVGDNIADDNLYQEEKDYEMIELLYGDYHAECGDRD